MEAFVSAGEYSGDRHAAETVQALNRLIPGIHWSGVAGPQLRAAGVEPIVPMEELNQMGTSELLRSLPQLAALLKRVRQECLARRPSFVLVVDSPDFNLRLIRGLRRSGIPVFYLAPPKAWAWRSSRTQALVRETTRVLALFRFEHEYYLNAGAPSAFVGNPLIDRLESVRNSVPREKGRVAVLPGSRSAELKRHVPVVVEALKMLKAERPDLQFQVPVPKISDELRRAFQGLANVYEARSEEGSWKELVRCEAALVKSGTSTLEAALLGTPHVVFYKPSGLTQFVFDHFVSYRGPIGLSNIISEKAIGTPAFPEWIGKEFTPSRLATSLKDLLARPLSETEEVRQQLFSQLKPGPEKASFYAASEIQKALEGNRPRIYGVGAVRPVTWAASMTWSSVNSLRRSLPSRPAQLQCRVVSVGNLQAGGAGKTPIVARIAQEAVGRQKRVMILSRGYQSEAEAQGCLIQASQEPVDPTKCGDEVALLQHLVPSAWIGVGADRKKQYERARAEGFEPDLVILDDGFQHRKIHKDLELLAVTSLGPSEYPFREFSRAAADADLVLWTKGDQRPRALDHAKAWASVQYGLPTSQGEKVVLVTGVGHGAYVRAQLERAGFDVIRHLQLRDHAHPSLMLVHEVARLCQTTGAKLGLTGKDWVKWRRVLPPGAEALVFEPELQFLEGRATWDRLLWGSVS